MSNNHLYTLSYFRKRLYDAGISSRILIDKYDKGDERYWTIAIFDDLKIFCTCLRYENSYEFVFSDDYQILKYTRYYIQTESMNVITEFLDELKAKKNASTDNTTGSHTTEI